MKENLVQVSMTLFEGKKVLTVGVKLSQLMQDTFQEICDSQDRPMSYVVRELALRGLVQYKRDGNLKLTADEENYLSSLASKNIEGKELATSSKKKILVGKDKETAEKAA